MSVPRLAEYVEGATSCLPDLVHRQRHGEPTGIYSVCSAHPFVLEAALLQALEDDTILCVESTSNQVNQFGGYTGATPVQFARYLRNLATAAGLPAGRLLLGGDHLGPYPWRHEVQSRAMTLARELVRNCVSAGYSKIHLDASMACADDPDRALDAAVAAERAADLCAAAEEAHAALPAGSLPPVYVVGTEVPPPGGEPALGTAAGITRVGDLAATVELTRRAFSARGLEDAWARVLAVVVQPGVDFGDSGVLDYRRAEAAALRAAIESHEGLVFEAHSTDYQRPEALAQLVEDHFAILKVGPWLTFAFREGAFALEQIEREVLSRRAGLRPSNLRQTLESVMRQDTRYWRGHYAGNGRALRLARQFSFSDRVRYYWPRVEVQQALQRLLENLTAQRPTLPLLSQYLPTAYEKVRAGELRNDPRAILLTKVREVLALYARACRMRPVPALG
jgi:D-tagatose-1,6-bisphosphate aldolase subunit GatZ/KbaZ